MGLRVLLTNIYLEKRAGTELYIRDLAGALLRRGHSPLVYTTQPGQVADEIRAGGVPVVDDISSVEFQPDVIHGHHRIETATALLRFPGVPAVFFCHDARWSNDRAPLHPRIRRYVAVGQACRERLIADGVPEQKISMVFNFVDLERFRPRGPLPVKPRRALVFGNRATETTFLPPIEKACRRMEIQVDVAGEMSGRPVTAPEEQLPLYDVVFAKGRSAIEAMATGAAVILCDCDGLGPMVASADFQRLRLFNFGYRLLSEACTVENILKQLARYDPSDAGRVRDRIREEAGLDKAVEQILALYGVAIREQSATAADATGEVRAYTLMLRETSMQNLAMMALVRKHAQQIAGLQYRINGLSDREAELRAFKATFTYRLCAIVARIPGLARVKQWLGNLFR